MAALIFDTKLIVATAFNKVNMVFIIHHIVNKCKYRGFVIVENIKH